MASQNPPVKNAAYTFDIAVYSQADSTGFQSSPTIAAGDFKLSGDGAALANLTNLPTASGVQITIVLTAAEMNYDRVFIYWQDAAGAEWIAGFTVLMTSARLINDLAFPTTTGRSIDVTATGGVGIDWSNVENPSSSVGLSATTIATSQVVASVSGNVGGVTGVTFPATVASPTNITAGTITTVTNLTNAPTNGDLTAAMKASVNAEVVDTLTVDTYAEPSGVVAGTATIKDMLNWIKVLCRNKITQTATTQTLRNDADSGNIATAAVSDTAGTATRGEWT